MSNHNNSGRDLIQVGRDYIRTIQINFESGNIVTAIIYTLPLILALFIVGNGVKWTVETAESQVQSLSGNTVLKLGQSQIIGESILLQAYTDKQPFTVLTITLPISDYKQKSIKLGSEFKGDGNLSIASNNGTKQYSMNAQGSDLTLKLDEAPMEKGKFIRGVLYGTATDGIEKQTLNLKLIVPFQ